MRISIRFFLFAIVLFFCCVSFTLSSCSKEDDNIEEPTLNEILTSQLWVIDSYVVKQGTTDPDDENAPFESSTGECLSKVLLSYSDDEVFDQYLHSDCSYGFGTFDRWRSNEEETSLGYYHSDFVYSKNYRVKSFSKEEVVIYQESIFIHGGGEPSVTIITFIPFS